VSRLKTAPVAPPRARAGRRAWVAILPAIVAALAITGTVSASPTPKFTRLSTVGVGPMPSYGMVRTADGTLHLVYQTTPGGVASPNGLAATSISPAGSVGQVAALQGWQAGRPGLITLPNGTLEAVFGAISPAPTLISSIWAITSSDGGATWSAPVNVKGGGPLESLAYGSDLTAQMFGSTPLLTLPQAGGLVIQEGLVAGSPAQLLTDNTDNSAGDVNTAVDAGSGDVVASWQSLAGNGGTYIQTVAPNIGGAQLVPGQPRNQLVIAGRDAGPGVFAAYTPDNTHVRLFRYGGFSLAVGSVAGVPASTLGVATGLDGRIWVMWGSDSGGLAVTRSNKAATKFEPIQHLDYIPSSLYRLSGDGRLGPLDLLVDEIPPAKSGPVPPTGTFHARVLPELSANFSTTAVKNSQGKVIAYKLDVGVTDAGDAVSGAIVSSGGQTAKTNTAGIAKLNLTATSSSITVTITKAGYQKLTKSIQL
jgi:hypothetical protein